VKNLFSGEGKVALVTGGNRGIGEMIATGYVMNGVKTYIAGRDAKACESVAASLSEHGECIAIPADLSSSEGVARLVADIKERESKLDILVNNAGANWAQPIDEFPESGWDKVQDLNLKAPFFLTQGLLPLLRAAGTQVDPARVINIASIDGMHVPGFETYAYSSSKAAVIHMTRVLAARLAREHITVNAIAPGPFQSKMMAKTLEVAGDDIVKACPRGRIGEPEDMAGVTIFLASPASAYITGTCIPVDGGIATTV